MTFPGDKPLSRILTPKEKPNDAAEKFSPKNSISKEKKPSLWSWKRLKALTANHRTRRFNCCFSLQINSIDGLPPFFDDLYLVVHWKRKDSELMTRPVQVYRGVAEFDEQLVYSCSVKGYRSGPDNSAKYEAKHFSLYASVYNAPELDLGSHHVDLARLLPVTLDELKEKGTGNWTTSFGLTGEGMGATMNVSFRYTIVGNACAKSLGNNVPEILTLGENGDAAEKFMRQPGRGNEGMIRRTESLPSRMASSNQTPVNVKELYEVLPIKRSDFSESVNVLYQKLDGEICNALVNNPHVFMSAGDEKSVETDGDIQDLTIMEKGIEVVAKKVVKLEDEEPAKGVEASAENIASEVLHMKDGLIHPTPEETVVQKDEQSISIKEEKKDNMCSRESIMKELETALSYASALMKGLDSHENEDSSKLDDCTHQRRVTPAFDSEALHQEHSDIHSSRRDIKKGKSFSMNDITSMATGFSVVPEIEYSSGMSSSESEPESPRERLLREFEKDAFANGGLLSIDIEKDPMEFVSNTAMYPPIPKDFHGQSMFECPIDTATCPPIPNDFNRLSMLEDISNIATCPPIPKDFHKPSVFEDLNNTATCPPIPNSFQRQFKFEDLSNTATCPPIPNDFHGPSVSEDLSNTATCLPIRNDYHRPSELEDLNNITRSPPIPNDFRKPSVSEDLCNTATCPPISNNFHGPYVFKDLTTTHKIRTNTSRIQTSASKLDEMETKMFVQDHGLNEVAFQHSPVNKQCGCDSGVDLPPEDEQQRPSLSDGWGASLQIKHGGLLHSMNPALLRNSKNAGKLVVQVYRPVVVPAEMGHGLTDILTCSAAMPTQKLSLQANKLNPSSVEGSQRQGLWQRICKSTSNMPNELKKNTGTSSCPFDSDTKYLSLDELAPLAMENIEALSIEGLKIQSEMPDQDAPSNVNTSPVTEIVAQEMETGSSGIAAIDGSGGRLQQLDIKDNREDTERLMALSPTLDEWVKLDSGETEYHYDALSNTTAAKLLAAHHTYSLELFQKEHGSGRRHGLLGNNLTFAFMVQLHDPTKNYEPVGKRMLALIQVERVLDPPKPKIFATDSQSGSLDEEEDEPKTARNNTIDKTRQEQTLQYKVSTVHAAGFKTLPNKKKLWGSKNKHKSGSLWLLAKGMGKRYKHPLMKSRPIVRNSI